MTFLHFFCFLLKKIVTPHQLMAPCAGQANLQMQISTLVSMAICEKSNTVENDFATALANWHELIKYVMER